MRGHGDSRGWAPSPPVGDTGTGDPRDKGAPPGTKWGGQEGTLCHLPPHRRCLPACPALVSLDLSANPSITATGLRALLRALDRRSEGLRFLSLAGTTTAGTGSIAGTGTELTAPISPRPPPGCSVDGSLDNAIWAETAGKIRELRLGRGHRQLFWQSP